MKRLLYISIIFALSIASNSVQAEIYQCPKTNYHVNLSVVFANGMFNSPNSAIESRKALEPYVLSKLSLDRHSITFKNALNTDDTFDQMYKVVKQRVSATPTDFIRMMSGAIPIPDWLVEEMKEFAADQDLEAYIDDHNLRDQLTLYRNLLDKGQQVLVVAHSQGNLYSNAVYENLFEVTGAPYKDNDNSFRIVAVATPTNRVAGNHAKDCGSFGCYTTHVGDLIIEPINVLLPDTLNPNINVQGVGVSTDLTYHQFVTSYLGIEASRNQILDHINLQYGELEDIEWTVLDGPITAHLSWEGDADLDLHVYERDYRDHVYSMYPAGSAGYLDVFDEAGGAPEHYTADCGYIEEGLYEFAVGYYSGEGPVTARMTVQAGSSTRSFYDVIEAPQGTDSYVDPLPFAWLEVSDLGGGKLHFSLTREDPENIDLDE